MYCTYNKHYIKRLKMFWALQFWSTDAQTENNVDLQKGVWTKIAPYKSVSNANHKKCWLSSSTKHFSRNKFHKFATKVDKGCGTLKTIIAGPPFQLWLCFSLKSVNFKVHFSFLDYTRSWISYRLGSALWMTGVQKRLKNEIVDGRASLI